MKVSIVIVNFNTYSLTRRCIQTLVKYTIGLEYEIILVDNASTECNPAIFKEIFPKIHLIKNTENVGFAKGNNIGISVASGEYILLLNSDVELIENSIHTCLEKMKLDGSIGVISPKLIYPNGEIQPIANRFPSITYELIELLRLHRVLGKKKMLGFFFDHLSEMEVDWVWGAFFLTKREIINQMPNQRLADDFFMYFEDVQWCVFIKKLGYKIIYSPATAAIHHVSASSKGWMNDEEKFYKTATNERFFLLQEKGRIYTFTLYFLRSLKFLSLRKSKFIKRGLFYWNFMKKLS